MKKKKRIPKAEFERKQQIKIDEKSKPDKHYHGVDFNFNHSPGSFDPFFNDAFFVQAVMMSVAAKRWGKMWGPVRRK